VHSRRRLAWISVLGVVSVGTLVATGIVNSSFLVGSIHALASTRLPHLIHRVMGDVI
jgi:hypothetical protein